MLAIDVEPLVEGVLPLPNMQCIGSTAETAPALFRNSDSEVALTARERDVALRLAAGSSRTDVSRQLGISPHTVTEFTRRIYRKLGVNNRARLAAKLASGT
jgi:DNA-binding CsgD family transcriptional regulator